MAAVDFFRRGRKQVTIAHFDHGTDHGLEAREFVQAYADKNRIPHIVGEIRGDKPLGMSWEEWWRDQRYEFLNGLPGPVMTAHTLDDAAEWWVYTSLHGTPRLIPRDNGKIIRPFLLTEKRALLRWCSRHEVPYLVDPTNANGPYMRTLVRHQIMPTAHQINPGLRTVIRKKYSAGPDMLASTDPIRPMDVPEQLRLDF